MFCFVFTDANGFIFLITPESLKNSEISEKLPESLAIVFLISIKKSINKVKPSRKVCKVMEKCNEKNYFSIILMLIKYITFLLF